MNTSHVLRRNKASTFQINNTVLHDRLEHCNGVACNQMKRRATGKNRYTPWILCQRRGTKLPTDQIILLDDDTVSQLHPIQPTVKVEKLVRLQIIFSQLTMMLFTGRISCPTNLLLTQQLWVACAYVVRSSQDHAPSTYLIDWWNSLSVLRQHPVYVVEM